MKWPSSAVVESFSSKKANEGLLNWVDPELVTIVTVCESHID